MDAAAYDASPVLIVGAGPTGLAAAMSLARAHIPVRLIDKALQPNPYSRAIGIQARTLELLEQHRLIEPFLELGHRARIANLFSNGMRLARLDFDPLHTRYPYLLFLDQSVTERLLTEHLATLGVTIERGVELTMFSQGSASIQATLRRADGHTETLRPSYMIAADGAHSTIRHRLGLSFEGKTFEQTFLLADLHAETDWPEDEFHIFASGEGLVALFPMGHGRHRLIADHAVEPPAVAAPPTPAVLGRAAARPGAGAVAGTMQGADRAARARTRRRVGSGVVVVFPSEQPDGGPAARGPHLPCRRRRARAQPGRRARDEHRHSGSVQSRLEARARAEGRGAGPPARYLPPRTASDRARRAAADRLHHADGRGRSWAAEAAARARDAGAGRARSAARCRAR